MAEKKFYYDFDLMNVGQLKGTRKQNVNDAEMYALGLLLNTEHIGLFVYNTDQSSTYTWNGTSFISETSTTSATNPELSYTDGKLTQIDYSDGSVRTMIYTGDRLTQVRYNNGILVEVKTFVYLDDVLVEVLETVE